MRASLCVGEYSETSYRIKNLNLEIFCIEELCIAIKENAFLLDNSILDDELTDWIKNNLYLKELAGDLYSCIHRAYSLERFVATLFNYVGLYTDEETDDILKIIQSGSALSDTEKKKKQIDFALQKGQFQLAISGYEQMLLCFPAEKKDATIKGNIYHNLGVAYMKLMLFNSAADSFMNAYLINRNPESLMDFLFAKRMQLGEKEYVAFVADHPEYYDMSLEVEKNFERIESEFVDSVSYAALAQRKKMFTDGDRNMYYNQTDELVETLKQEYRASVEE